MALSKANRIALTLGLVGVAGGIIYTIKRYAEQQIKLLEGTEFNFVGMDLPKIKKGEVTMKFAHEVVNKSDIEIEISKQRYMLYINNKHVANIYYDEPILLNPHSKTIFPLIAIFSLKTLIGTGLSNVSDILMKPDKVNIDIKGVMTLRSEFVYVNDFEYSDSYNLQEVLSWV